ncbi:MAG: sporulation protein, partial [Clostridiaceae bacterium]|nr:sporulation protein [Clostridiaceae bacterium]
MKRSQTTRSYLVTALLLGFLTLLLIDPQSVIASGKKAVNLCINIIIPSLLPFFVISRLILKTGAIHPISRFFRPVMR